MQSFSQTILRSVLPPPPPSLELKPVRNFIKKHRMRLFSQAGKRVSDITQTPIGMLTLVKYFAEDELSYSF